MSTPPLFVLDPLPDSDSLTLGGVEGAHAARVKRVGVGERVLVGDGRGNVAHCTVSQADSGGLVLRVDARRREPPADPRLVVVQALPKADRAELTVEVLTELGADEIVPWAAARSVGRWRGPRGEKALAKWRRTAVEATKRSRRAWVPDVAELASAAEVAVLIRAAHGVVLHEAASEPLTTAVLPTSGEVILVVGPEGGLSDAELAAFRAAGADTVRMGGPVLRTSTAGGAALAVLSSRFGRWA